MDATITSSAGRDEFMQLLVAQLQNQDPLQPVPQHEFLAQLAQFSTLEGIEKLNSNFEEVLKSQLESQDAQAAGLTELNANVGSLVRLQQVDQGASLIGNHIIYEEPPIDGGGASPDPLPRLTSAQPVEGVELKDGTLQLRIGENKYIPMGHVYGVVSPEAAGNI